MAWTAGADVSTGDLITAADWNNYMGASGSLEYLKAVADLAILEDGANPFTADQAMGGFSLTGLAAGAAAGESVRHEQLAEISHDEPANALNTNYQNSAKIRIINVTVSANLADTKMVSIVGYVKVSTPADDRIASNDASNATGIIQAHTVSLTLIIPPSWYYRVTGASTDGAAGLLEWHEWDLH